MGRSAVYDALMSYNLRPLDQIVHKCLPPVAPASPRPHPPAAPGPGMQAQAHCRAGSGSRASRRRCARRGRRPSRARDPGCRRDAPGRRSRWPRQCCGPQPPSPSGQPPRLHLWTGPVLEGGRSEGRRGVATVLSLPRPPASHHDFVYGQGLCWRGGGSEGGGGDGATVLCLTRPSASRHGLIYGQGLQRTSSGGGRGSGWMGRNLHHAASIPWNMQQ